MAIYSAVPPPAEQASHQRATTPPPPPPYVTSTTSPRPTPVQQSNTPQPQRQQSPATFTPPTVRHAIDIDAWTINALEALSVSPIARGTRSPLTIKLDHDPEREQELREKAERKAAKKKRASIGGVLGEEGEDGEKVRGATFVEHAGEQEVLGQSIRRPLSRRDSQRKREMILKGKEGSRQRRRWENDRLMHVPNVQPPLPSDYEPHPTHPVHHTPYALATYWDASFAKLSLKRVSNTQSARKRAQLEHGTATGCRTGEVPRDLREQVKRSEVVRGWVRALEEPIRGYMSDGKFARETSEEKDGEVDSDDEEIVFSGRGGKPTSVIHKMARREVENRTVDTGMVLDSFGDDDGSAFKRWLTHTISHYYGLESRSVIIPNPSRKVVYVGLKQGNNLLSRLPRPLWEVC